MSNKSKAVLSVRISPEVIDKLRNVVYLNRDITLNQYVEMAIVAALSWEEIPVEFESVKRNLRRGSRLKKREVIDKEQE